MLRRKLKELWDFLNERVSITITPSSRYRMYSFRIRSIVPIVLLIIIIASTGILGFFFNYYRNSYLKTKQEFAAFKARTNVEELQNENKRLKKELVALTRDTQRLSESLQQLKEYNSEIREMINMEEAEIGNNRNERKEIDFELTTVLSYNTNLLQQGIPAGGRELHLYYQKPTTLIKEMQKNINYLQQEVPEQKNSLANLESGVKEYNARQAATPALWPVADGGDGYVSDNFGWRVDPMTNKQKYHEGLDIAVWYNTPVLATADGTVSYAGWKAGYGLLVKIRHGFGYETYYAHLNKVEVERGQKIERGKIVGLSGNSGRSTGPHLHYEVRLNNIPQNPRKYIGR